MTITEVQNEIDLWIKKYGVRYFNDLTNLSILMEEVGELARIYARKFGEQSFKETETKHSLEDEMADILFVLMCMANQNNINLEDAMRKNLAKKTNRDSKRHLGNKKLK
ncbi:MAG: nucleotide pyrophosphohydrolase [Chitinophagales bacterium]|nr:nucleotide pyrophosphohydrolase [Chitinophagales bacterium]